MSPGTTGRLPLNSTWQRYLGVAGGVTRGTAATAEAIVRILVKQGEVAADRAERAVDEVAALVRVETERAVAGLGLARQADVDALAARVEALEQTTRPRP